ncbi:hypothetical protein EDB19DRAFT_1734154 [Suillus lakei]|nr:hypothetical protein EDB19DRAFT_1734154 [Suillus lakei]
MRDSPVLAVSTLTINHPSSDTITAFIEVSCPIEIMLFSNSHRRSTVRPVTIQRRPQLLCLLYHSTTLPPEQLVPRERRSVVSNMVEVGFLERLGVRKCVYYSLSCCFTALTCFRLSHSTPRHKVSNHLFIVKAAASMFCVIITSIVSLPAPLHSGPACVSKHSNMHHLATDQDGAVVTS